jgi:hypothetical protein
VLIGYKQEDFDENGVIMKFGIRLNCMFSEKRDVEVIAEVMIGNVKRVIFFRRIMDCRV